MLSASCARLTQLFSYSLSQKTGLFRTLSLSASVHFRSRQRGRGFNRPAVSTRQLREEDAEHFDRLEDFINERDVQGHGQHLQNETGDLLHRYVQQQQRKVKKKIVGRKYFQEPQEVNLLTWNAKQQIRYLHQQLPEDWTPQQLAQSFPISEEGVRRLLKNSYVPRSEEEIAKHDRRVKAHWLQLRQTLALGSGPGEETQTQTQIQTQTHPFQHIIEAGKLPLMINAGGSAQLAAPRERCAQRGGRMGVFESILAGSQDTEAQRVQKKIEGKGAGTELLKEIAGFRNRQGKEIPAHFPDKSKYQR